MIPVSHEAFRQALLIIALAGIALVFSREWPVRIAGGILVLPRLLAARMSSEEWIILGATAVVGIILLNLPLRKSGDTEPEFLKSSRDADDVSEPAPCPSCRGIIPAGLNRCPNCGWTYVPD